MEINKSIINHAVMRTKVEQIMNYKFDGAKVYFTSDTHFNHANIIGFCSRPFKNVNEMNETLIANWNRVVGVPQSSYVPIHSHIHSALLFLPFV